MNELDRAILKEIQTDSKQTLRRILGSASAVALLDFPTQQNAGDMLIWSGELAHLAAMGIEVGYRSDMNRFNAAELRKRVPEGPILLSGGGNFGDLWPWYQDFRERVVEEFPDRQVVCLPQSVLFRNALRAEQTREVFVRHGNVVVLVRDYASKARAEELLGGVRIEFCYDMAFGNAPWQVSLPPLFDIVSLKRGDQESALPSLVHERLGSYSIHVRDWGLSGADATLWNLWRGPLAIYKRLPAVLRPSLERATLISYASLAHLSLRSAGRILSNGRVVVTDRLHAHVMCILLGKPHVVLDNSYGKIGPIYEAYSGRFSTSNLATSVEDGADLTAALLRPSAR